LPAHRADCRRDPSDRRPSFESLKNRADETALLLVDRRKAIQRFIERQQIDLATAWPRRASSETGSGPPRASNDARGRSIVGSSADRESA
jgi:hypothetical protein